MIYAICDLSSLKQLGDICGCTTVGLKHLEYFLKLLKTLHRINSAKILLLPDILSVYYLQETDLISRSIWEKYSAKILGRNTHLMVRTFTGFKYRRFKYGIPAQLQNLILQYYAFSVVVFFFYSHFFLSHFCFHCLLFVMFLLI